MNSTTSKPLADRLILGAVILLALLWTTPLLWVFALSFKPNEFLMEHTDVLFSPPFTFKNYTNILGTSAVFQWIVNSIVVSLGQTFLTLVLASLAGYGFARTQFPGKRWVFAFVLAGLAVPEQAIVIPLHRMFAEADMHNTYSALILPRLAAPFGVFLMTQYFKAIPMDIEEAALLDNASRWRIFLRIILPLSIPAQATLGPILPSRLASTRGLVDIPSPELSGSRTGNLDVRSQRVLPCAPVRRFL